MRRPSHGDAGATSVEFALVLPLLVALLGIGAFFAWSFYVQAQIDRAAERAARYAAVPTTAGGWSFCKDDLLAKVNADLVASTVEDAELTLSDSTGAAPATCAGGRQPVGYVRVRIAHTYSNPFSSIVATLTPLSGTATVVGAGQTRVEAP